MCLQAGYVDTALWCSSNGPFYVGFNTNEKWTWTDEHRKCIEVAEFTYHIAKYTKDEFRDRIEHYMCDVPGCGGSTISSQRCYAANEVPTRNHN